jgi:hypothetical protein
VWLLLTNALFAIIKFECLKIDVHFLDNLDSTIGLSVFVDGLVCRHLDQVRCRGHLSIIICRWLPVGWGWHQLLNKSLVLIMRLPRLVSLFLNLIRNKLHKFVLGYVFHVLTSGCSRGLMHKPLKNFLKSVLSSLLVSYIIAES